VANSTRSYVPLIVRHALINLPSARSLAVIRQKHATLEPRPAGSLLVVTDPSIAVASDKAPPSERAPLAMKSAKEKSTGLAALPSEAALIQDLFPGALIQAGLSDDPRANVELLSQFNVIHFATYATASSIYPTNGDRFPISSPEQEKRNDSKRLTLSQIYHLRLATDIVVMSACDTFFDGNPRGDWLAELANGFFHAGARHVVASLWPVPDRATTALLKRFYQGTLKKGINVSAALRQAQAEMWSSGQWSPSDWAGFVVYGDW
jgi:CHAT domain-containing protein